LTGSRNINRRRVAKALATLIASAFVFGPSLAGVLGVSATSIENRELAKRPSPSQGWGALDALTAWASDHLPGRNAAVRTNAWVDYHALREMPPAGRQAPGKKDPLVVRGKDGHLFLGDDFVRSCDAPGQFNEAFDEMLQLAEMIQASGRNVVFVVAPNKSSVATEALPRAVPRGDCARRQIRAQERRLNTTDHPLFLNLLPRLRESHVAGEQPYWKTDTHWSPTGGAIYARAVADRLEPGLGARLGLTSRRETFAGDLSAMLGLNLPETALVTTVETGTVHLDPFDQKRVKAGVYYGRQHWTTRPAKGLVPGKTVLLGDSFDYYAMESLRPLFADGTFLWVNSTPEDKVVTQIAASDTVVLEVVQRAVHMKNAFAQPRFQAKVAKAISAR
jgi:hypothetical protein